MNLSIKHYIHIWQIFFENITLSLYSQKFYEKVYQNFKGLGLKHFLLCCTIASVINTAWLFSYFNMLSNYFAYNLPIPYSSFSENIIDSQSLDEVFNNLPEIEYDGKNISFKSARDQVFYIKSPHNQNINLVLIDLDGSLPQKNYPVVTLLKNQMWLIPKSFTDYSEQIPYSIISTKPCSLNGEKIKEIIGKQIISFKSNFLYKIFPLMMLVNIYYSFAQNIVLILLAAFFVKYRFKRSIKDGIRVAVFAISPMLVLRAVVKIFVPNISFVEYYSVFLAFLASRAIMLSQAGSR